MDNRTKLQVARDVATHTLGTITPMPKPRTNAGWPLVILVAVVLLLPAGYMGAYYAMKPRLTPSGATSHARVVWLLEIDMCNDAGKPCVFGIARRVELALRI